MDKMHKLVLCLHVVCCHFYHVENTFISQHLNQEISKQAISKFWYAYTRALLHSQHDSLFCCETFWPKNLIDGQLAFAKKVSRYIEAQKWSGGAIKWKRVKPHLDEMYM